jgi:nitrogen fixation/metabolism regulation signal transduction histidine kinase
MKPKISREIKVENGEVKIISTIDETFTKEEFKAVIKNKERGLENLKNQKAATERQMKEATYNESQDLQKAKRLFGKKLQEIFTEFMNKEIVKRNQEQLTAITNDMEVVEKDITDFTSALSWLE